MRRKLSEIMKKAWNYVKELAISMSDALKIAWMNMKAKSKMYSSIVIIQYRKKDGSIRTAEATLNSAYLPAVTTNSHRKINDKKKKKKDIEKQAFRTYIKTKLISIYFMT